MAVGTANLAFADLGVDRRQTAGVPGERGDGRALATHVIELEDDRVAQATIDTR
jgi:hypothetical protein